MLARANKVGSSRSPAFGWFVRSQLTTCSTASFFIPRGILPAGRSRPKVFASCSKVGSSISSAFTVLLLSQLIEWSTIAFFSRCVRLSAIGTICIFLSASIVGSSNSDGEGGLLRNQFVTSSTACCFLAGVKEGRGSAIPAMLQRIGIAQSSKSSGLRLL